MSLMLQKNQILSLTAILQKNQMTMHQKNQRKVTQRKSQIQKPITGRHQPL